MKAKSTLEFVRRFIIPLRHPAMIAIAAILLGTGCVTNGRHILLKEYSAGIPPQTDANINGKTVCIKGFTCAPSLVALEVKDKPEEPNPYKYAERTRAQDKIWNADLHVAQKQAAKSDQKEIGNMRNGFGMVMSHVYALNDPAEWLAEGLKYDLEAQGAKVVDASQAADADVTISGTIQLCRADMYMTEDAHLVVDLDVQPKHGEPRHRTIHTHGATAAVLASEGEYFHAFRDAREKFSIFTVREISQALKANQ
jgi:hypothetical protein